MRKEKQKGKRREEGLRAKSMRASRLRPSWVMICTFGVSKRIVVVYRSQKYVSRNRGTDRGRDIDRDIDTDADTDRDMDTAFTDRETGRKTETYK